MIFKFPANPGLSIFMPNGNPTNRNIIESIKESYVTNGWDRIFVRSLRNTSSKKQCHCLPLSWKLLSRSPVNKKYLLEYAQNAMKIQGRNTQGVHKLLTKKKIVEQNPVG